MLMRFILLLLLGYIGFRIFKGILAGREKPAIPAAAGTETFQDPVCGVYVTADDAVIGRVEEKKVYFCSHACLEKYRETLNNHK
jgi:YHS domain-containing protein